MLGNPNPNPWFDGGKLENEIIKTRPMWQFNLV